MTWIDAGPAADLADGQTRLRGRRPPHGRSWRAAARSISPLRISARTTAPSLQAGTIEGAEIICPRHGARFCLRTGEALTPPAYEPVRVFATKIDGGHLWVRAD